MKIENLKVGMVIKNYKELCKLLEIEEKGGSSKKAQMKELNRYCKFIKKGYKFKITKIYDEPLPKEDNRSLNPNSRGNNYHNHPQFKVPYEHSKNIGVYAIILNHQIYIGSTTVNFRTRFLQHRMKDNKIEFTYKATNDLNSKFVILKEMNGRSELEIRLMEDYYIKHYIENTDWEVMNQKSAVASKKEYIPKPKYKSIKVLESDYEKALQILQENNINIKQI